MCWKGGIAVGNQTAIKLNYAPKQSDVVAGPKAEAAPAPAGAQGAQRAATSPVPVTVGTTTSSPMTMTPAASLPAASTPAATTPGMMPPATAPPLAPGVAPAPPSGSDNPAATGSARVQFSPPQVETRMGSQLSLSLMLDGGADVSSAPMQIQYDPKVLKLNDVMRGDFLSSGGQQPVFTKNIMPDLGMATVQLNRQPGTPGVNGAGVLLVLNFQAVGRGATVVSVPNLTVRNSQGVVVSAGTPRVGVSVQ